MINPPAHHGSCGCIYCATSTPSGVLPTTSITARREPRNDRSYTGRFVGMVKAVIAGPGPPEFYPQPGDVNGIGRDSGHDGTNRLISNDLAIAARNAIVAPNFLFDRVTGALRVDMPRGRQTPITERVNIKQPKNMAFGDLTALDVSPVYTNLYAKLV